MYGEMKRMESKWTWLIPRQYPGIPWRSWEKTWKICWNNAPPGTQIMYLPNTSQMVYWQANLLCEWFTHQSCF